MNLFIYKIKGNEINDIELNCYYDKIDVKKRKQIEKYENNFDKSKCFIAHLIVYLYFKGNIKYKYNYNGRITNDTSNEYFNISYSGKYLVVIFNDDMVGIDIEKINQIEKKELDYFASDLEKKFFKTSLDFTKLWCLKESYLKYLGIGITNRLKSIEFQKFNKSYVCRNNKNLFINVFKIDKNYVCSIVSSSIKQKYVRTLYIKNLKKIIKSFEINK